MRPKKSPRPSGTWAMPRRARALGELRASSSPSKRILPASAWTMPEIARSVVVLPAPLAPSSATTSPAATCRSSSRRHGRSLVAGREPFEREDRLTVTARPGPEGAPREPRVRARRRPTRGTRRRPARRGVLVGLARAITVPNSSTTMRSQMPRTRPMSWSISRIDWPSSASPRRHRPSSWLSRRSSPAAGSSRQIRRWLPTSARATPTNLRSLSERSSGIASAARSMPSDIESVLGLLRAA